MDIEGDNAGIAGQFAAAIQAGSIHGDVTIQHGGRADLLALCIQFVDAAETYRRTILEAPPDADLRELLRVPGYALQDTTAFLTMVAPDDVLESPTP